MINSRDSIENSRYLKIQDQLNAMNRNRFYIYNYFRHETADQSKLSETNILLWIKQFRHKMGDL